MTTIKMSTRLEKAVQDYLETLGKSFATVRLSDTEVKATFDGATYYYKLYASSNIVLQYNTSIMKFMFGSTLFKIEKIGEMTRVFAIGNTTMQPIDDDIQHIYEYAESYVECIK